MGGGNDSKKQEKKSRPTPDKAEVKVEKNPVIKIDEGLDEFGFDLEGEKVQEGSGCTSKKSSTSEIFMDYPLARRRSEVRRSFSGELRKRFAKLGLRKSKSHNTAAAATADVEKSVVFRTSSTPLYTPPTPFGSDPLVEWRDLDLDFLLEEDDVDGKN